MLKSGGVHCHPSPESYARDGNHSGVGEVNGHIGADLSTRPSPERMDPNRFLRELGKGRINPFQERKEGPQVVTMAKHEELCAIERNRQKRVPVA